MQKTIKFLSVLFLGCLALNFKANAVEQTKTDATTRSDAVIFKIHEINPVSEDGVVNGCDFTVTLYNRTAINFRSFTINLQWADSVDERFKFERYMESYFDQEELAQQREFIGEDAVAKPLQTAITVNAFGADKQISVRSHVNNEKCYLMLSRASYSVTPCDIVRSIDTATSKGIESKECTELFQYVDTGNPEYFGQFKKLSATEMAAQSKISEKSELSDVDEVIEKIVENLGVSDQTLTNIN